MSLSQQTTILNIIKSNLGKVDTTRAKILDRVDFVIADNLPDPRAAAQFELQDNGRALITVKKSNLTSGASWNLYNSIAHEITHFEQSQDPLLADFFKLHPNAQESAKFGLLIEIDAYVKTQSLMDDLQTAGIVVRGAGDQSNFGTQIDDMYKQIKDAGYSHETGDAQKTLFRTLAYGTKGQFASAYIFPRLENEISNLVAMNQEVIERNISPRKLVANQVALPEVPAPDPSNTVLGRVKGMNFMTDDEGQTDFLKGDGFLKSIFTEEQQTHFTTLVTEHSKEMVKITPYISFDASNDGQRADGNSWSGSLGNRTGRIKD